MAFGMFCITDGFPGCHDIIFGRLVPSSGGHPIRAPVGADTNNPSQVLIERGERGTSGGERAVILWSRTFLRLPQP